jgi:hypothetical protein
MTKRWLRACMSAVLAGSLLAGGCTASPGAAADSALADVAVRDLLRHVPADTPYVFIGLGESMRPFAERVARSGAPLWQQIEGGLAALPQEEAQPADLPERVLRALVDELRGKFSLEGLEQLGFDLEARYVVYGLGVLPAARLRLRDGAALRAVIDRVQTRVGAALPSAKLGDQAYWHVGDGKVEVIVAIVGDELVVGAVAGPTRDRALALLLGQELPADDLAGASVLREVMARHGLSRFSVGFVDTRRLVEALVGAGEGLNRDTAAALGATAPTPACADEYRGLAELMPRMVFGTTKLDAGGLETKFVLELRPDLAAGVDAVRVPVPGIAGALAPDAMFSMASGVDVAGAIELARAQAAAVVAAPYRCPQLAELNDAAAAVVRGADSVPATVRQLRGGAAVLEDLTLALGALPTNVRGYMTVATADPQGLVAAVSALAPELQLPAVANDGTPQRLSFNSLPLPIPFEMFIAGRAERGLAVTVGAGAEERAGKLLLEPSEAKPLLLFHYNYARFLKVIPAAGDTPMIQALALLGSQGYVLDAGDGGLIMRSWFRFPDEPK